MLVGEPAVRRRSGSQLRPYARFRTVVRDPRGYASWPMGDGLVSPWREGDRLYLFAGRFVHVINLPVRKCADDPQPRPEGGP